MSVEVPRSADAFSVQALVAALSASGFATSVMMIDGQLVMPRAEAPRGWRDVRLRTPGGTVTLARREGGVAVVVFGNADAAALQAQQRVADAINALP